MLSDVGRVEKNRLVKDQSKLLTTFPSIRDMLDKTIFIKNRDADDGLKVPMTQVTVSQTKQLLVQDTLEQITGQVNSIISLHFCFLHFKMFFFFHFKTQGFKFKQSTEYADSGENLSKFYWMTDNQLRVYGVVKHKAAQSPKDLVRRFAVFALSRYY